MCGRFIFLLIK